MSELIEVFNWVEQDQQEIVDVTAQQVWNLAVNVNLQNILLKLVNEHVQGVGHILQLVLDQLCLLAEEQALLRFTQQLL